MYLATSWCSLSDLVTVSSRVTSSFSCVSQTFIFFIQISHIETSWKKLKSPEIQYLQHGNQEHSENCCDSQKGFIYSCPIIGRQMTASDTFSMTLTTGGHQSLHLGLLATRGRPDSSCHAMPNMNHDHAMWTMLIRSCLREFSHDLDSVQQKIKDVFKLITTFLCVRKPSFNSEYLTSFHGNHGWGSCAAKELGFSYM